MLAETTLQASFNLINKFKGSPIECFIVQFLDINPCLNVIVCFRNFWDTGNNYGRTTTGIRMLLPWGFTFSIFFREYRQDHF